MALNAYERKGDTTHLTNGTTLNTYDSKHLSKKGGFECLSKNGGFECLSKNSGFECLWF